MKYMILGGGGVFGNLTARHLLTQGHEVIAVGRSPLKEHWHLDVGKDCPRYQYHQMHIVYEHEGLKLLLDKEQPEYIVNFAALAYANSWENPTPYYRTNLNAVITIAEHLKGKDWLRKFIQIGSSEVYGSTQGPAAEDYPAYPTSPYAVSKLAADLHLLAMKDHLPVTVIRPSNCYGEGQYTYRIIPKAILYLLNGMTFPLEGGGKAEKSFMHADDLATAIERIAQYGQTGVVYNAGADHPLPMHELIREICRQLHKPMEQFVYEAPGRAVEDSRYWIDSSRLRRLGWEPRITLEEGIARMIAWCTEYREDLNKEPSRFTLRP